MSAPVQMDLTEQIEREVRAETRAAHAESLMRKHLAEHHGARPDTYADRYRFGCLIPGESCPGCGHRFTRRDDASGDHHMTPGRTECEGRIAYRKHAQHAATHGTPADLERAIRAAAPCWTADDLRAEVTA